MNRFNLVCLTFFLVITQAHGQKKITLEDIWSYYTFYHNAVPGFNFLNDGKHYTRLERNKVQQYDLTNGKYVQTVLNVNEVQNEDFRGSMEGYTYSADESKIMIHSETEPIYRRSSRSNFFVYDRTEKTIKAVFPEGKQMYATFNPEANKVAFVFQNNLYLKDLDSDEVVQVTHDGEMNKIINGALDWVYEEEFGFAKGFEWSPDGRYLAFYHFDESEVKEFTMTHYQNGLYPDYETFKYPKVGEDNSIVNVHIYDLKTGNTAQVDIGTETDQYIPRIKWTQDPGQLCVYRLNRHQNNLDLLLTDAATGKTSVLLSEQNEHYISEMVFDNIRFLPGGRHFIWTSEKDGWHHIYLYDMGGKLVRQITKGDWEVTEFYGVDEENGVVFYQAAENSPLERQIYSIGLDGKNKRAIAAEKGVNSAQFSSTFDYYVLNHSTFNTPPAYEVFDREGSSVRMIEDNARIRKTQEEYGVSKGEFFTFTTSEDVELNGWMIKPPDFKENRQYPVFMFVYGGPGSQTAEDQWMGQNYWWFQSLAQQGYIVASVDNRGTGGRGEAFKKSTYLNLGKYETTDQIEAAKYLGSLPYADAGRIGIFGWSYGGYMSSLCLLKGSEVFKAAIAVAPVTNWRWYDTIYTERFMRTSEENPDGYWDNSPVNFVDQLKGSYLLVHGNGDDNVHFQHTAEMANALIKANKQFDTYFYPNRNHGIYGDNARLHLYTKMTNFLHANLRGPVAGKPIPQAVLPKDDVVPKQKPFTEGKLKKKKVTKKKKA